MEFSDTSAHYTQGLSSGKNFLFKDACFHDRQWLLLPIVSFVGAIGLAVFSTYKSWEKNEVLYVVFHPGLALEFFFFLLLFLQAYFIESSKSIDELFSKSSVVKSKTPKRRVSHFVHLHHMTSQRLWCIPCVLMLATNPIMVFIAAQDDVNDPFAPLLDDFDGKGWYVWAYIILLIILLWSCTPIVLIFFKALRQIDHLIKNIKETIEKGQWEQVFEKCIEVQEVIDKNFRNPTCGASLAMTWILIGILIPLLTYTLGSIVITWDAIIHEELSGSTSSSTGTTGTTTTSPITSTKPGSRPSDFFVVSALVFGAGVAIVFLYEVSAITSAFDKFRQLLPVKGPQIDHPDQYWYQRVVALFSEYPLGIHTCGVRVDSNLVVSAASFLLLKAPMAYAALRVFIAAIRKDDQVTTLQA